MRFGKIQYLNLMPFDVFLKSYPIPTRYKSAAFANRSYPSKLNQSFLFHRIDAGFISTIAGCTAHRKQRGTQAGIVAKGAVWSVLSLESNGDSALGEQCGSVANFVKGTTAKVANLPQSLQSSHSPTATPRILEENNQAESEKSKHPLESLFSKVDSSVDSKETSANAERYPLFSKEAMLCHGDFQSARNDKKSEISEKTPQAVGFVMRKQGASTQVSGFSKAQSTNEKPTPETSHNDSKICGGAVVALHTFGGRSYLGGNDYPPNVCNQSHCSPKAESPRKDYQSDTSNALSTILGLQGRVLIGDRALQYRFSGGKAIDMGQVWWEKHRLPFVFGRLCYNKHAHFYSNIARAFVKKRAKIPHYILQARAKACGIPSAYIREYLTHIHYHIQAKERAGLERFYRALRLQAIKPPSRIYPRNVDSSKCAPNAPYKGSSNV
ncbi:hypothetical protein F4V45_08045 [Helicobacter canis]|uniref:Chorismate dehydratase n=1 Tax=Helicobacter canis TaxID=29419 RepID=A0A5M9QHC6_9HELI|nr:hypothetical protein F4V45_08045 [Helicobacter canis]